MAKNKLSKEQMDQIKKKQLDDGDLDRFFKLVINGITDDNREEYEFLRRKSVNLGDVYEFYAGLDMRRDALFTRMDKELGVIELTLEKVATPEQIKEASRQYESHYKKVQEKFDELEKSQASKKE